MCKKCFVDLVQRLAELGELTEDEVHVEAQAVTEYPADTPMYDYCEWCHVTTPPQPVKHVCGRCEEETK